MQTVTIGFEVDNKGAITGIRAVGAEVDQLGGGLGKVGKRGKVEMDQLERSTGKTVQTMRMLASSVGLTNTQFLALARLGPAAIIAAIGAATILASQRFESFDDLVVSASRNLRLYFDKWSRFMGFGESDLLKEERRLEQHKLLLPLLNLEREARHRIAIEGLGFARNKSQAHQHELRELELLKQKQIDDLRQVAKEQGKAATEKFGKGSKGEARELEAIAKQEAAVKEAIEEEARRRRKNLEEKNAHEISKLRTEIERDELQGIEAMRRESQEGFLRLQNEQIAALNEIERREAELFDEHGFTVKLNKQRDAIDQHFKKLREEMHRRNAEETLQIEESAALATVEPWSRAYAEIGVEANQRVREIQDALRRTLISEQDAARRVAAVWAEASAQMRETLISDLERILSPQIGQMIRDRFKRIVLGMLADLLMFSKTANSVFNGIFGPLLGMNVPLMGGGGSRGGSGLNIFNLPGVGPGGTPVFNPSAGAFAGGGSQAFPITSTGSILGDANFTSQALGIPLSAGGGAGNFAVMPASRPSFSSALKGALPGLAISGGMMAASSIGFGGPGRGALSGGLLGASVGYFLAAPFGWVALGIGLLAGALIGIFNRGKKRKKRDDVEREAFRAIDQVKNAYNVHALDYMSAVSQLEQIRQQVNQAMAQLKWPSRMDTHIDAAIRYINQIEQERQRRLELNFGPPQFAAGGYVSSSMASPRASNVIPFPSSRATAARHYDTGGAVPAILHAGEFVLRKRAVDRIGRLNLDAMNNGTWSGGSGGPTVIVNGPLVQAQVVDEAWVRNGGAEMLLRELRRAR